MWEGVSWWYSCVCVCRCVTACVWERARESESAFLEQMQTEHRNFLPVTWWRVKTDAALTQPALLASSLSVLYLVWAKCKNESQLRATEAAMQHSFRKTKNNCWGLSCILILKKHTIGKCPFAPQPCCFWHWNYTLGLGGLLRYLTDKCYIIFLSSPVVFGYYSASKISEVLWQKNPDLTLITVLYSDQVKLLLL